MHARVCRYADDALWAARRPKHVELWQALYAYTAVDTDGDLVGPRQLYKEGDGGPLDCVLHRPDGVPARGCVPTTPVRLPSCRAHELEAIQSEARQEPRLEFYGCPFSMEVRRRSLSGPTRTGW